MKKDKNNILDIHFRDFQSFREATKNALKSKTSMIQPKNIIYFDSIENFRKFMTLQKIEILIAIANKEPNSIYELAQIVDRDFSAVLRDCNALAALKFILLEEENDARGSKTPKLPFSYSCIRINFPKNPYEIEFAAA